MQKLVLKHKKFVACSNHERYEEADYFNDILDRSTAMENLDEMNIIKKNTGKHNGRFKFKNMIEISSKFIKITESVIIAIVTVINIAIVIVIK